LVVGSAQAQTIQSPNESLTLTFSLSPAGEPTYQINLGKKAVILPSKLGIEVKDQPSFIKGFTVAKVESSLVDESWNPVWGEVKTIRNHYRELKITLQQPR
jgi:hypothetical protein